MFFSLTKQRLLYPSFVSMYLEFPPTLHPRHFLSAWSPDWEQSSAPCGLSVTLMREMMRKSISCWRRQSYVSSDLPRSPSPRLLAALMPMHRVMLNKIEPSTLVGVFHMVFPDQRGRYWYEHCTSWSDFLIHHQPRSLHSEWMLDGPLQWSVQGEAHHIPVCLSLSWVHHCGFTFKLLTALL